MGNKVTALYCRVSTDAQYEEGYSIDAQKELLEAYCKSKRITNYKPYVDGGYSGGNLNRPHIKQLIEEAKAGVIERVVVYKLDRLSRSQKDTLYLIEDVFIPNGVDFVSINESFDTATPFGRAMIGILSVFAQLERDNIRMRTRMGMLKRVEDGYWMGGGIVPFGYDYDKAQGILVPNDDAAKVKEMYALYLKGYSCERIAHMFDLKYDKLVNQILTRKSNTGIIQYKGNEYQGRHEPIIDIETYEETMREMKRRAEKKDYTKTQYLFTGMLYCGKCGARMRYQKWGRGGRVKIVCYSQQASKKYLVKDPNCDNKRNWSENVDNAILADFFSHIRMRGNDNTYVDKSSSTIELLTQKRNSISAKIKNLYVLFADNPDDTLRSLISEKKKELEETELMIEQEQEKIDVTESAQTMLADFDDLEGNWKHLSIQDKRSILQKCIEKVLIFDNRIVVHYKI